MAEKIQTDLNEAIEKVEAVKELLTRIYYDPDFSSMFTKPVISMLISGCDYVSVNLGVLKQKIRQSIS